MGLFDRLNKPAPKPYYRQVVLNDLRRELEKRLPPVSPPERHKSVGKTGISDRVGIEGIYLNHTQANHIVEQYGMAYDLWDINGRTLEMKFNELGLSSFFHQDDPQRKIFSIRMWKEFPVFQQFTNSVADGWFGYLSLNDVFSYHMNEYEPTKSYDETYVIDFGFMSYHIYLDERGVMNSTEVESIVLKAV